MFLELESNNMFKTKYFELLKYRLASCSIELEENNIEVNDPKHSIEIFNQLEAINYIFDNGKKKLNHIDFTNLLCGVVSRITNNEIDNFRNVKIMVNGSKVNRTKPEMIRNDLWYLIDDYNYLIERCKTEEEILEVEAQFHIRLLHIHPFEDANGRTSRIFLLYNMCKNNIAPFVITKERKKEYCNYIENSDYKGLAKLFKELSNKELRVMVALYTELDNKNLILSNNMSSEQKEKYKKLKR